MKKNIFKSKKWLLGILGATTLAITPIVLTACGKISKELVNKTVSKGNGWDFATNGDDLKYDINTMSKKALESDAGQKAISNYVISKLSLDWFERVSKQKDQTIIKRAYDKQVKAVNDEYKDLIKSRKNQNGADFAIKFQQEDLDPVGGNESAWKEKKMLDWAKSELTNKLFETSYLTITKNNKVITYPNLEDLVEAVQNTTNDVTKASFTFSKDAKGVLVNNLVDGEYAKFQKFVYDKWLEIENPYVVNMSLWKYGTPEKGINTIFKNTATGVDDTTTANPGKYPFPYFQTKGSSVTNGGTVSKFNNFITDAKTKNNFVSTQSGLKEIGIREINAKTYTEDSSTLILAKNGTIYNDLYIEFAASSSYLFDQAIGTTTSKIITPIANIEKDVTLTENDGLDAITSNFVSKTAPTNGVNPSTIKISTALAKEIINENGPAKTLASSELYVIDAFKGKVNQGLDDFLFIRDEAGVHAIAIEGKKFISTAKGDVSKAKQYAGNIVLFHYFGKKIEESELEIDINKELSTFFGSNTEYLVSEYIKQNNGQTLFNLTSSKIDDNLKNLFNSVSTYMFEISKIDRVKDYNEKMFNQKQTYANSYGVDTKKNGFASGWIFSKTKNIFDVANTSKVVITDPFNGTNGSYENYKKTIEPYVTSLGLTTISSSFEGFKYSQYILSNNYAINTVLLAFGADSNSMGDSIKIDVLNKYVKDDFDLSTLKFKTNFNSLTDVDKINNALINSFYSATFDGLSNKWTQYDKAETFDKTKLDDYKLDLYKKTLNVKTSAGITNNLSLLTTISTAKYLLENNGAKFIEYLQNKITTGKDYYVAWYDSFNNELSTNGDVVKQSSVTKTIDDLLNVSNMKQNIANNYNSVYQGMKATTTTKADPTPTPSNGLIDLDKNNKNSYFSTNTSYYSHTEKRLGYKGLIDSDSTIDSEAIKDRLFRNKSLDNPSKKGLLYSYVSRDELKNTINNFTYDSEIQDLAEKIQLITGGAINVSDIFKDATTPQQKKDALTNLVSDSAKITDAMFQKRDNHIGYAKTSSGTSSTTSYTPIKEFNSSIYSGAYVYQINKNDVKDWNTLKTALNSDSDAIYHLLIDAAKETSNQDAMIESVISKNKFSMYDSRINTQLGPKWLNNWKG